VVIDLLSCEAILVHNTSQESSLHVKSFLDFCWLVLFAVMEVFWKEVQIEWPYVPNLVIVWLQILYPIISTVWNGAGKPIIVLDVVHC
jgi:hypothetical protein